MSAVDGVDVERMKSAAAANAATSVGRFDLPWPLQLLSPGAVFSGPKTIGTSPAKKRWRFWRVDDASVAKVFDGGRENPHASGMPIGPSRADASPLTCSTSGRQCATARPTFVAGVDEAGRGPLAGPVVVAAVILDPKRVPKGLDDWKQADCRK